ncbi:hypothetical protein ZWY2020_045292 [Hordeum vulgare]|nr:hypothetical protein ZWY2020_045292 [Hordeum vulgare]
MAEIWLLPQCFTLDKSHPRVMQHSLGGTFDLFKEDDATVNPNIVGSFVPYVDERQRVSGENGYCEKADMEWKPHAPDFKHKNLVKLTIYGFHPDDIFVRFIRCAMEHAVNMAEIFLHDRKVCLCCDDLDPKVKSPSRYPWNADERKQIIF